VLCVGALEVRGEEDVRIHDNDGTLWLIERSVCFSEAAPGSEKRGFTGKSEIYTPRTSRCEGRFDEGGLGMGVGHDDADAAAR
jgi:hypothetical protein